MRVVREATPIAGSGLGKPIPTLAQSWNLVISKELWKTPSTSMFPSSFTKCAATGDQILLGRTGSASVAPPWWMYIICKSRPDQNPSLRCPTRSRLGPCLPIHDLSKDWHHPNGQGG